MRTNLFPAGRHIEEQPKSQPVMERGSLSRLEMKSVKINSTAELVDHIRHLHSQITVLYMRRVTNDAEMRGRGRKKRSILRAGANAETGC
jgi:hypothetical protein